MTQEPKVASPVPLKRFAEPVLGKMLQPGKNGPDEKLVPYLKAGHVQWSGIDIPENLPLMWASPSDVAGLQPSKGDLLVCEGGEVGRAALVQEALPEETIIQNSLHLIREGALAYPPYLKYAIEHIAASGWLDLVCNKATIAHLTVDKLRVLPIPYWTHPAQTRIANFLDEKTGRIDALIAEKERLTKLLLEEEQSCIDGAVLGGQAPLSHFPFTPPTCAVHGVVWRRVALKRCWQVTDCKHLTVDFVEDGFPLASIREVSGSVLELCNAKRARQEDYLNLIEGGRQPRRGDLIYARNASVGAAAYVDTDEPFAMGQDVCLISSADQDQRFLRLQLMSSPVKAQLEGLLVGATIRRINVEQLRNFVVLVPPPDVQREVVQAAEAQLARRAELRAHLAEHINVLREYRSSLISAAVTGQLNIYDFKARPLEAA